jgi:protein involved in polysaccharide export with SLBB domain
MIFLSQESGWRFSVGLCLRASSHKPIWVKGVTRQLLTLGFFSMIGSAAFAQDWVNPNNGVLLPGAASNLKVGASAPIGSAQTNQNVQNEIAHKIGVRTQSNLGNVNSPPTMALTNVNSPPTMALTNNELEEKKDWQEKIEEKNQFQKFIFETTGINLNSYGHSLFARTSYAPVSQAPTPVHYVIGPGDEIDIKVWGSVEFNVRQQVDRDGRITLPQLGSFGIAGTRVENLDEILKRNIGRIYKGFFVSGTLSKIKSIQIYVVGHAKKPGAHTLSGMSTLVSGIFDAGGPLPSGTMRKIRLLRDGTELAKIDLYDFIKNGESSGNVKLMAGDVIQFPPVGKRVALLGAIDGQGIYELNDKEDSLGQLIDFVGETNTLIAPKKVLIERVERANSKAHRSVEERSLNQAGREFILKDGDLVYLSKINHQYANAVNLKVAGAGAIRFKFSEGMRISDLIPEPQALMQPDYYIEKNKEVIKEDAHLEKKAVKPLDVDALKKSDQVTLSEINWEYAVIERLDVESIKVNLLPFNLERAIKQKDADQNLRLVAGDTVIVFSNKELSLPQSKRRIVVTISGEVSAPGLYQLKSGETINDLLKYSGGFTGDAYVYGTHFSRKSAQKLQLENLTKALSRIETEVNAQSVFGMQNSTSPEGLMATQQTLVAQKAFLNRIKTIQPNGRIALELNPAHPKLPEVVLEDGDEIFIPTKPSFVGVFGAVYAESTFIHKSEATVKDYLSKAGLSRESDVRAVMVIRADGSIESNFKNSGMFGQNILSATLHPGDTIFVPELFDRRTPYTQFMQGAKDWTTLLYQFALGAAAWKTLKN